MPHASADFDWNDRTIQRLRVLWAEGLSTAEIGRRMGIGKNAVIGKSHRLDLPARPSPIRAKGPNETPRAPRPRCPSLTELQSRTPARSPPPPRPKAVPVQPVRTTILGNQPCCWPIGEPGTPSFRFCGEMNEAGKPYCPDHCAIAYLKRTTIAKPHKAAWSFATSNARLPAGQPEIIADC